MSKKVKDLELGVVSFLLWDDFHSHMVHFIDNLEFLVQVGFGMESQVKALDVVDECVKQAKITIKKYHEKAGEEIKGQPSIAKPKNTFEDHRFWEYIAQIKIDGHDPADILEAWLKEHKPDYFEDV